MPAVMQVVITFICIAVITIVILYVLFEPVAIKIRQWLLELQNKEAKMIRLQREREDSKARAEEEAWQELGGRPNASIPRKDE